MSEWGMHRAYLFQQYVWHYDYDAESTIQVFIVTTCPVHGINLLFIPCSTIPYDNEPFK